MNATDVETEAIEHLDFEHEVPCDARDCSRAAEYSISCRTCDLVLLACKPCLRWYLDRNNGATVFDCRRCDARSIDFLALVHIHTLH
ncbi:hypothetical protein [Rathayibacter sp. VKM Ac-2927]|uniref:hypothetical protein n=1 Tax=Rathayibacter sp. VKM Ac-2927 TaxID=2929478 RepID=UPI001FB3A853|nr:hypothetical protein [Rathayibacter sp. VKM Ac-2927]MCJ1687762.1 hypothetical protein [Rathayibacter sp. VKM Ac-2927]